MTVTQYDSLIFDLDGTLWDACPASAYGWNQAFKKLGIGIEVSADDIRSVAGKPFEECVRTFVKGFKEHQLSKLYKELAEGEEVALKEKGGVLYEGVEEGLEVLSKQYPLYIVSNCQEWYIHFFTASFPNAAAFFKDWECIGRTGNPKSDNIRDIVRRNKLINPVYIGDTEMDRAAAEGAGVEFIHAAWGFGTPEKTGLAACRFADLKLVLPTI